MKDTIIKTPLKYTVVVHDDLNNETIVIAKFKHLGDAMFYTNSFNESMKGINKYVKCEVIQGKLKQVSI